MHKSQQHINIHSASEHTSLKTISILFFFILFSPSLSNGFLMYVYAIVALTFLNLLCASDLIL